jgi:iron(III) transport system substrate-binding protein
MRKIFFLLLSTFVLVSCSTKEKDKSVTVYVSEDQVFSEPVLKAFEKETGIRVNALYDTEESKSTGAMNRLIAEKNNPRADVYWANEPIRAEVLRQKGILAPYQSPSAAGIPDVFIQKEYYWTGFSARIRILLVNNALKTDPESILYYTEKTYKGKIVIANPLFGTTTSHIAALFTVWGDARTKAFLNALKQNDVAIATSNGESADFVASGRYLFSLVDSDDAMSRLKQKAAVHVVYPDQEEGALGAFVVPNAVMMIKGAPHPDMAKKLIDYLLSRESERKLAFADCAQIPLHAEVEMPKGLKPIDAIKVMQVDYAEVAKKLVEIQPYLKRWLEQ